HEMATAAAGGERELCLLYHRSIGLYRFPKRAEHILITIDSSCNIREKKRDTQGFGHYMPLRNVNSEKPLRI
ncbi:MAG: hypothetical protein Q4E71_04120, partial [Prevotella sp.]|nr:hypothetical protein [Prevotella sp.]